MPGSHIFALIDDPNGVIEGDFATIELPQINGIVFREYFTAGRHQLTLQEIATPEPATWLLLAYAAATFAIPHRFRAKQQLAAILFT